MIKVYQSPSSQHANIGVIPGYVEETYCNYMADASDAMLAKFNAFETKRNNPANTYASHVTESNAWGAELHVCYHTNAASSPDAFGISVGCFDPTDVSRESTKFAIAIQKRLQTIYPYGTVKLTKYTFAEVTQTKAKVAYIECGFHTNERDCRWIMDNHSLIGKTIALGIADYKGLQYVEQSTPTPDWQGQLNEKDATIAQLKEQIVSLTNQIADKDKSIANLTQINDTYYARLVHVANAVDTLWALNAEF